MKTKRSLLVAVCAICLVLAAGVSYAFKGDPGSNEALVCPLVTLTTSPTSMNVCNKSCNSTALCRGCSNSYTLSNGSCSPFTWTFTNTTTGCVISYQTTGTTLTVSNYPGAAGDNINLVITNASNGVSPTYSMTGVQCN